jgi:hypothetical protein
MTTTSIANRICDAFAAVDAKPDSLLFATLRTRLLGELLGDAEGVASTLSPEFELVMHGGPEPVMLGRDAVLSAVRQQATAGALMWTEFGFLRESEATLSGHGVLCTLAERTLVTMPVAAFLRYEGATMVSEVVFAGAAVTRQVSDRDAEDLSPKVLREALTVP